MKKNTISIDINRPVTQATIASAAGVSQQSVSQILNGTGRITDEVRQHVLGVASRLNYRPNKSALALRQKVHGSIGLLGLCNSPGSYISNAIIQNLEIQLFNIHKYLTFIPVMPSEECELIRKSPNLGIDGAIISLDREKTKPLVNTFQSAGIPEIWFNSKHRYNCVYPDDYKGAFDLTSFLITNGYDNISYVGIPDKIDLAGYHYSVRDRYQGYFDAMVNMGITPRSFHTDDLNTDIMRSLVGGRQKHQPLPTLLCYEGSSALRTLLTAKGAGIDIPRDLKIIYFHPQPHWEDHLDSLIRCLPIPNVQLAQAAVKMFEDKTLNLAQDTPSVAVPYDSTFFEHILTTKSYRDFNI